MKAVNKIELKGPEFENCFCIVDSNCSLGQLYDYACSLRSFVYQKMQEVESQKPQEEEKKD